MDWAILVGSGVLEAVWATALGASRGLRRLLPTLVFVVASEEGEKECRASDSQAPKPRHQPSATEEDLDQRTARGGHGEESPGG